MAIIDCEFWKVRRSILGVNGGSHRGAVTLRRKPAPCDSNRARQQRSRSVWAYCSWAWHQLLTDEDRASWDELMLGDWWVDYLGEYVELVGFQVFMAFASRAVLAGWPCPTDGMDSAIGNVFSSLELELFTTSRIRVTWTPALDEYNRLVLFGSGPLRPGQSKTWVEPPMTEYSTPRGWRWIGSSAPAAAGPLEFDLDYVVASGMHLVVMAGGVDYSGFYPPSWVTAEAYAS